MNPFNQVEWKFCLNQFECCWLNKFRIVFFIWFDKFLIILFYMPSKPELFLVIRRLIVAFSSFIDISFTISFSGLLPLRVMLNLLVINGFINKKSHTIPKTVSGIQRKIISFRKTIICHLFYLIWFHFMP